MDVIGFTDDEINQLNNNNNNNNNNFDSNRSKQTTRTSGKRSQGISQPLNKDVKLIGQLGGASLSKPADNAHKQREFMDKLKTEDNPENLNEKSSTIEVQSSEALDNAKSRDNVTSCDNAKSRDNVTSCDTVVTSCVESDHVEGDNPFKPDEEESSDSATDRNSPDSALSKVHQLQATQAKLQKQNRRKQKELKQTITEKFAKTTEQAQLLVTLQQEVSSVEKDLTCDITILRDRIDHCNRRYYDARKRLEAAEAEFVAAKLDLHHSQELKEGLEEHLFTIIKLSETKKSERLEQLNQKLESLNL